MATDGRHLEAALLTAKRSIPFMDRASVIESWKNNENFVFHSQIFLFLLVNF